MEQFYKDEVEKLSPRRSDYKIFRERGIWLGGLLRAAKVIHKARLNKKDEEKLFSEMVIMKSLDHTKIVRLYEVYDYKAHYVLIL